MTVRAEVRDAVVWAAFLTTTFTDSRVTLTGSGVGQGPVSVAAKPLSKATVEGHAVGPDDERDVGRKLEIVEAGGLVAAAS